MQNVNGEKLRYLAIHCCEELLGRGKKPTAVAFADRTIRKWGASKGAAISIYPSKYRQLGDFLYALSNGEWSDASVLDVDSAIDLQQFKEKIKEFVRRAPTGQATLAPFQPTPVPTPEPLTLPVMQRAPNLLHRYCQLWREELLNPPRERRITVHDSF